MSGTFETDLDGWQNLLSSYWSNSGNARTNPGYIQTSNSNSGDGISYTVPKEIAGGMIINASIWYRSYTSSIRTKTFAYRIGSGSFITIGSVNNNNTNYQKFEGSFINSSYDDVTIRLLAQNTIIDDWAISGIPSKIKTPSIGEFWSKQGGYYIGNIVDSDDGMGGLTWALILAPKAEGQNDNLQWSITFSNVPGTSSNTNGWANSNAMNSSGFPAAFFCRGLTIGGFEDWYFPAKDEIAVAQINRDSIIGEDSIDVVNNARYISSTQSSTSSCWSQIFSTGAKFSDQSKSSGRYVRAMRRVLIG